MLSDLLFLAFKNLQRRKLRAWLTTLGVVIGISSVVSLITIGTGMEKAIEESFSKMGKDKLMIFPGKLAGSVPGTLFMGKPFTIEDAEKIEKLPDVKFAVPIVFTVSTAMYKGESYPVVIFGLPPEKVSKMGGIGYSLYAGRFLRKGDKYSCIVGYKLARDVFSENMKPGSKLKIGEISCKVVGIWEPTGSSTEDYAVYLPINVLKENFHVDEVRVIVAQAKDVDKAITEIKKYLKRKRGEDFSIMTAGQVLSQAKMILGIVSLVVVVIAGISLIVSAIGIMNTMYMAVTERTKEIGIMKAIGAKNKDILLIFLFESGLLGMIGGIVGNVLGLAGALLIEKIAVSNGYYLFRAYVDPFVIIGTILFAFLIGVISGIAPARAASKLDPVEALREE